MNYFSSGHYKSYVEFYRRCLADGDVFTDALFDSTNKAIYGFLAEGMDEVKLFNMYFEPAIKDRDLATVNFLLELITYTRSEAKVTEVLEKGIEQMLFLSQNESNPYPDPYPWYIQHMIEAVPKFSPKFIKTLEKIIAVAENSPTIDIFNTCVIQGINRLPFTQDSFNLIRSLKKSKYYRHYQSEVEHLLNVVYPKHGFTEV